MMASTADHIADVLLVSNAFDGIGWVNGFLLEVRGHRGEQLDARGRIHLVAPQQRLEREAGFIGRDTLAQARFQMRMSAQRVEAALQQFVEAQALRSSDDARQWCWQQDRLGVGRAG